MFFSRAIIRQIRWQSFLLFVCAEPISFYNRSNFINQHYRIPIKNEIFRYLFFNQSIIFSTFMNNQLIGYLLNNQDPISIILLHHQILYLQYLIFNQLLLIQLPLNFILQFPVSFLDQAAAFTFQSIQILLFHQQTNDDYLDLINPFVQEDLVELNIIINPSKKCLILISLTKPILISTLERELIIFLRKLNIPQFHFWRYPLLQQFLSNLSNSYFFPVCKINQYYFQLFQRSSSQQNYILRSYLSMIQNLLMQKFCKLYQLKIMLDIKQNSILSPKQARMFQTHQYVNFIHYLLMQQRINKFIQPQALNSHYSILVFYIEQVERIKNYLSQIIILGYNSNFYNTNFSNSKLNAQISVYRRQSFYSRTFGKGFILDYCNSKLRKSICKIQEPSEVIRGIVIYIGVLFSFLYLHKLIQVNKILQIIQIQNSFDCQVYLFYLRRFKNNHYITKKTKKKTSLLD
ncbi:unnamed protein product (macronuclear) [Paramecium tetraurelia]|uniref:Transmembrane protein n=1 Tax=Paramecium tetraurelia TaxID=5888 RepID=A0DDJ5_PARTE|nr:uncharacterized protein GSPATT00015972001 [Paramecium tetraurelia]CAK81112.1 unnamed protein product [Paramecium tetraurelia]|eukprot:XP_001448509.1 hypothetical protein (macronuclear) [Paramecium tetraurelia strain d4-2]